MSGALNLHAEQDSVAQALAQQGYVHTPATQASALFGPQDPAAFVAFAASWNALELDSWMADRGAYRRRRHAVFRLRPDGSAERQPHQPHYQSLDYNRLNGGVARWFAPMADAEADSPLLRAVLAGSARVFAAVAPVADGWKVEVHQFRIEANPGVPGLPTPEGMHRDGVDWVLVLMIHRHNIAAGTTTIHDLQGTALGSFTLSQAWEAAWVDDHRCFHGVTPVLPLQPDRPGWRDVLVVTLRRWRADVDEHPDTHPAGVPGA